MQTPAYTVAVDWSSYRPVECVPPFGTSSVPMSAQNGFPVAERGVYTSSVLVAGHVWVYSVDHRGKQVNFKTVNVQGLSEEEAMAEVEAVSTQLWAELDRVNPLPRDGKTSLPSLTHLRIVR